MTTAEKWNKAKTMLKASKTEAAKAFWKGEVTNLIDQVNIASVAPSLETVKKALLLAELSRRR
jgi:hypothetical protein